MPGAYSFVSISTEKNVAVGEDIFQSTNKPALTRLKYRVNHDRSDSA